MTLRMILLRCWPVGLMAIGLVLCANTFGQTSFTYQGRLTDGGVVPVSGQYDLKFGLWDAVSGGSAVGSPLTVAPVPASNGVFTVSLDFGATAFNGSSRWLEISVRTNGSVQAYQVLSPCQAVTYTPQALYALTVADGSVTAAKVSGVLSSASIPGLDASKITSGVIASNRLPANITYTDTAR